MVPIRCKSIRQFHGLGRAARRPSTPRRVPALSFTQLAKSPSMDEDAETLSIECVRRKALNGERIACTRAERSYCVPVSLVFVVRDVSVRAVLGEHEELEAARRDGAEPRLGRGERGRTFGPRNAPMGRRRGGPRRAHAQRPGRARRTHGTPRCRTSSRPRPPAHCNVKGARLRSLRAGLWPAHSATNGSSPPKHPGETDTRHYAATVKCAGVAVKCSRNPGQEKQESAVKCVEIRIRRDRKVDDRRT